MRWLFRTVTAGSRTLETGCGYSTIAFAAAGAAHTVVSPGANEQARVRDRCAARGVSTGRVEFARSFGQRCWSPTVATG